MKYLVTPQDEPSFIFESPADTLLGAARDYVRGDDVKELAPGTSIFLAYGMGAFHLDMTEDCAGCGQAIAWSESVLSYCDNCVRGWTKEGRRHG